MMDFEQILEECLEKLADGETAETCLAQYPQHAAELRPLLAAAEKMGIGAQVHPLPKFKTQAREQLMKHMQANPRQAAKITVTPLFRLGFGMATLLLAFFITGTALAQSALPGDALYPWKLASEHAWLHVAPDPLGAKLALTERRIDEALASSGSLVAMEIALRGYDDILANLETYTGLADRQRIEAALQVQDERLNQLELPSTQPYNQEDVATPESPLPASTPETESPISTPNVLPLPVPTLETPDLPVP
jgi:hypothetical protein